MRIGIVGTGSMGANHLRITSRLPGCQLTCAVDINQEQLQKTCQPYEIKKISDYRQISNWVDAVMISTPTETHFDIARYFIEHGKHIIIEKPITQNLDQARQLLLLAKKHRVLIAVGMVERFNPAVTYIKPRVENPVYIEIQRVSPFSARSIDIDVILDLMIHDLDIVLYLANSPVTDIRAVGMPVITAKTDLANVRLNMASGLVVNLTASRVAPHKTRTLCLYQKDIHFFLDYQQRLVKSYVLKEGHLDEVIPEIESNEPLYNLWQSFYSAANGGENKCVTIEDGIRSLELALKISTMIETSIAD